MTKKYHFWISGCQMNYADARQVANRLEALGYEATATADNADVIVLQTCTVRQQAEDRAYGRLLSLRPLKEARPNLTLAMMGCVVGVKGNDALQARFPHVDLWLPPASDGGPLVSHLLQDEDKALDLAHARRRFAIQDGELALSLRRAGELVSAPVAVVYGCSHACSFCIIPQRRGIERTRPVGEIVAEVRQLAEQGVKEVVLLGQIVDRYGRDIPDGPDLADLLIAVQRVDGLERIRFLTSHPNYMTDRIIRAVAELPKVMPQIEVPMQAGDNQVLANMKRGYTAGQYRDLIARIRDILPDAAIHNDIIVGFPGETVDQFQRTYDLLAELEFDKVHLARYSPRPGTLSARQMEDDVPDEEKRRRFHELENLQKAISQRKMKRWLGTVQEVLVEDRRKGRWQGRTPQGKLVFFDDDRDLSGHLVEVKITHTGPWSMSGSLVDSDASLSLTSEAATESIPLSVL
ncbi:MAG: tRNA (N6-isopentenyl adenosine(37)-C2)-methylthiotransferase MiaB [Chloroflexota bacterium]|nr:MAG: tRNA (N6-isopentenyl adenosine(37)-C2)-methylthiotransferase MiaB [Chloroflexota bacterium]